MSIRQVQLGDFTVLQHEDRMSDDVIIRPNENSGGASLITLGSFFMDYGHVADVLSMNEEQYQKIGKITDSEELEAFINSLYTLRSAEQIGKEG